MTVIVFWNSSAGLNSIYSVPASISGRWPGST